MTELFHVDHSVGAQADVGATRRDIGAAARTEGLPSLLIGTLELAVTELATNLVLHAGGGHILARVVTVSERPGFEVVAIDRGPGIRDLVGALGESGGSGRGLGAGLAGVRRLASDFDIQTERGRGTVVLARFLPGRRRPARSGWGGICVPLGGTGPCGDGWSVDVSETATTIAVVDGLGHGPRADEAASAGLEAFEADPAAPLLDLTARMHEAMSATRGGSTALCRINQGDRRVEFVGVGNISGRILGGTTREPLLSRYGTVGGAINPPLLREYTYVWPPGGTVVLHSDGVREAVDYERLSCAPSCDPVVTAGVILRDYRRDSDDATVVVVRGDEGGGP